MPEINNSLAMQVNSTPLDLKGTLGTISQIELAQAHAGLYGLQAQQEARKLAGLSYLKENPSDYLGAIQRGLDPSVGNTLQTMGERERAYGVTPGGISPESFSSLSSARRSIAETGKTGIETDALKMQNQARIAQGYLAAPSDQAWQSGVSEAMKRGYVDPLNGQQLLAVRDPQQREQMARAWIGSGVSSADYTAPHNVSPTDIVTSRAGMINMPMATAPMPQNRAAVPSSPGIVGDDEAVMRGLYSPTPEQIRRGVTGPANPNAQVANRFGSLPAVLTPQAASENKGYGEMLAKTLPALAEKADQAKNMSFTLEQMRNESATWPMGKGSTALLTAQQYLKPIANAVGSTLFDKPVADYEAFQKNAGTLVRQAVKEVSSRAAVQEFQMIQNQLPSSEMSRQGFNQIVDQFQAVNDYQVAKHQAAQAWRDSRGTMDKFDAEWNKNLSPTAFLIHRMTPQQLQEVAGKLQKTPDGRSTLNNIKRQMQYAQEKGLF